MSFYFAVDSFCIYVIRSQHKRYWGHGVFRNVSPCRSVNVSQNVRAHSPIDTASPSRFLQQYRCRNLRSCDGIARMSIPESMKQVLTSTSTPLWGMITLITKHVYQILYQVPYILSWSNPQFAITLAVSIVTAGILAYRHIEAALKFSAVLLV